MTAKKDVKIFPLFPTPVLIAEDQNPDGALKWALDLRNETTSVHISNKGGYQTPARDIEDCPYHDYLKERMGFLPPHRITEWWVNINKKGDHNTSHCHPDCDMAGIWYLTDNFKTLAFANPFVMNRTRIDPSSHLHLKASEGSIVVFPADTMHHVDAHNMEDALRVSMSFNIVLHEELKLR